MSGQFVMIPRWLIDAKPSPVAQVTYIGLASFGTLDTYEGAYEECRPALATLADRTGLSVPSVRRGIDELLATGAITRTLRYGADGGQLPSVYRVHFAGPTTEAEPTPPDHGRAPPLLTGDHPPCSPVITNQEPNTQNPQPEESSTPEDASGASVSREVAVVHTGEIEPVPPANAGQLTALWIDYAAGRGVQLTKRLIARYGKAIKEALESNFPPRIIGEALRRMLVDRVTARPDLLDTYLIRVQQGPQLAPERLGAVASQQIREQGQTVHVSGNWLQDARQAARAATRARIGEAYA